MKEEINQEAFHTGGLSKVQEHKGTTKKRKYGSRIKDLAPNVKTLATTYQYQSQSPVESARIRNNKASKTSRERRKMYIQVLQEQITNLQFQLDEATEAIQDHRTQIFNALMHTNEVNSHNAETQSHVLRKLKGLVQEERHTKRDTEINIYLDSCIYRIGASGSERKAILEILYSGMINRNLPNIYRYILWSAANHTHLFQKVETKKTHEVWWNEIKEIGEEVVQTHQKFLEEKGDPLSIKAREIIRCSRQILQQKQQIERYGQSYDQMLKGFRQILNPVQFAELFLFAQRSVHKKELELLKEDNHKDRQPQIVDLQSRECVKKIKPNQL